MFLSALPLAKPSRTASTTSSRDRPRSVQLAGELDLGVDDAVVAEVFGGFPRDAVQRVPGLHHADRVANASRYRLR